MSYVDEVLERVIAKNPSEKEFHQAVREVWSHCVLSLRKTKKSIEKMLC